MIWWCWGRKWYYFCSLSTMQFIIPFTFGGLPFFLIYSLTGSETSPRPCPSIRRLVVRSVGWSVCHNVVMFTIMFEGSWKLEVPPSRPFRKLWQTDWQTYRRLTNRPMDRSSHKKLSLPIISCKAFQFHLEKLQETIHFPGLYSLQQ